MTTIPTRRALLRMLGVAPALAALPALALPASRFDKEGASMEAPIIDPIFAAIERAKAARASRIEVSEATVGRWYTAWREQRPGWEELASNAKADVDRDDEARKIEREASDAMHETVPTTLAGIRALLLYTQPQSALLKSPIFAVT